MATKPIVTVWPQGRYRLTEESYIGRMPGAAHERLAPDTEIVWDGLPGPHMEPLDAQARANVEHAARVRGAQTLDPTVSLSLVLGETDDIDGELAALEARMQALVARRRQAQMEGRSTMRVDAPSAPIAAADAPPAPVPVSAMPGMPAPLNLPPPPPG